jgi:hypothetical protein
VIPIPAVLANAVRDALGTDEASNVVNAVPMTAERLLAAIDLHDTTTQ